MPSDETLLRLLQSVPVPIPGVDLESILTPSLVTIPSPLRKSLTNFITEPAYKALSNAPMVGNVTSLLLESLDVAQQVPKLVDEVEAGARDFVPSPDAMSSAARRAYRCRRTLLVQFENDALDDSEVLEGYLREAESVMKTKRPMITIDLQRKVLGGNHLTPLLGPAGGEGWGERLEEALGGVLDTVGGGDPDENGGAQAVREKLGYQQVSLFLRLIMAVTSCALPISYLKLFLYCCISSFRWRGWLRNWSLGWMKGHYDSALQIGTAVSSTRTTSTVDRQ